MLSTPQADPIRVSEYPRAEHFLIHFSDTHLLTGHEGLYGSVDSEKYLRDALHELEESGARPEAFIFTGDLADKGDPLAYSKLKTMVEPVAARLGADVIWLMGNHDNRTQFRSVLYGQSPDDSPIDHVYQLGGLRVIALDSSTPGKHHGTVTLDQKNWLRSVLAIPATEGTILAMHHPPIPSVLDLAVSVELHDQESLAAVLRGSDVRAIIAGHLHYSSSAMFAGIPVSVASATCYTQDLTAAPGSTRPRDSAQAFNLIHVYEQTIVHSVVPIGRGPALQFTSAADSAALLATDGIRIRS